MKKSLLLITFTALILTSCASIPKNPKETVRIYMKSSDGKVYAQNVKVCKTPCSTRFRERNTRLSDQDRLVNRAVSKAFNQVIKSDKARGY